MAKSAVGSFSLSFANPFVHTRYYCLRCSFASSMSENSLTSSISDDAFDLGIGFIMDRIIICIERKPAVISEESRRVLAYHEGGHTLVAIFTKGAAPVHNVTIILDDKLSTLGMVTHESVKDTSIESRKEMFAELDVLMGGRAAEELVFGEEEVTFGANGDIDDATAIAQKMVTKYGMSKAVGLVADNYEDYGCTSMSVNTRFLVECEVRDLIQTAYENVKRLLTMHQHELHMLATTLLERGTMTGVEIKALFAEVNVQANTAKPSCLM